MLSNHDLKYHYHPEKGWMNDPNGLVYFDGFYHAFYQHVPDFEKPWEGAMTWGHARTRDFLNWEELPVALYADEPYDKGGAWSGTACVDEAGKLHLYYASVDGEKCQRIATATSEDGIHFTKSLKNPIIPDFPADGSKDFRDPAFLHTENMNYLVIASGDVNKKTGNLLLYRGTGYEDWEYVGVLYEVEDCKFCECPSFVPYGDGYLLSASVVKLNGTHYFEVMYGSFDGTNFHPEIVSHFQKGPDEYAGQIFCGPDGRCILISWVPGWRYTYDKCIGALSLPLELTVKEEKIYAYPVQEVRHLLDEEDKLVDAYLEERFINKGEEVYITLLQKEE